jgi:hypothetical protein
LLASRVPTPATVAATSNVTHVAFRELEGEIGPRHQEVYLSGFPMYTLDRIDNDRGYAPGNLRWAAAAEQARNKHREPAVEGRAA